MDLTLHAENVSRDLAGNGNLDHVLFSWSTTRSAFMRRLRPTSLLRFPAAVVLHANSRVNEWAPLTVLVRLSFLLVFNLNSSPC